MMTKEIIILVLVCLLPITLIRGELDYSPRSEATQTASTYHITVTFYTDQVSITNFSLMVTSMPSAYKAYNVRVVDNFPNKVGFDINKTAIPANDTHMVITTTIAFDPPLVDGVSTIHIRTWENTIEYSEVPLKAATAEELLPVLVLGAIFMVLIIPFVIYQRRKKLMIQAKKIPVVKDVMKRLSK